VARRDRDDREPPGLDAVRTRRQQLRALLRREELSFDLLRELLGVSVRLLEEELRHVERTARGAGERLRVSPARCLACGFVFRHRAGRHLHAPGRCPRCRSERIADPAFRIEGGEAAPFSQAPKRGTGEEEGS
jgi:predicted Zn-ribbon and HTH transcriptional regulator